MTGFWYVKLIETIFHLLTPLIPSLTHMIITGGVKILQENAPSFMVHLC